jgi:ABC-type cobalamin/Fe3+-siderophores transport system ATPase subunit
LNPMLAVDDLSFSHGKREILKGATFRANPGEFLALVGINGAGKSTMLDILAGLRKSNCGTVHIGGRERCQWSARDLAQRISHLPQTVNADLPFTAEQLVAMGRYPHTDRWFESEEDHIRIRESMERTHCWQHRDRTCSTLSGGERQRVLLAACLAQNASIVLLDEPSTFLDIEQQLHCFAVLRGEAERGKVCIAVTHDLNLALTHCTRLLVLADGAIVYDFMSSQAHEDRAWLDVFSSRLRIDSTPAGTSWIWYQ